VGVSRSFFMYVTVVWVEERSHGAGFGSEF
jgi:hypothetical protein